MIKDGLITGTDGALDALERGNKNVVISEYNVPNEVSDLLFSKSKEIVEKDLCIEVRLINTGKYGEDNAGILEYGSMVYNKLIHEHVVEYMTKNMTNMDVPDSVVLEHIATHEEQIRLISERLPGLQEILLEKIVENSQ